MRLLMLAPPGAGKGTQATRLAEHFGIEHIASGDLLREEIAVGTPLGQAAKEYLDRGDLVPDEVVVAMVAGRVLAANEKGGFVLDGFPRNIHQAEEARRMAADAGVNLDAVIYLHVNDEELLRRLLSRAKREGRSDDQVAVIRHRLDVFNQITKLLIDYFDQLGLLLRINGEQPVDAVTQEILQRLAVKTSQGPDRPQPGDATR
jgi:adenylate kinase